VPWGARPSSSSAGRTCASEATSAAGGPHEPSRRAVRNELARGGLRRAAGLRHRRAHPGREHGEHEERRVQPLRLRHRPRIRGSLR
jgi:hypothetical protein